jgi:CheY-like chemotaxis protein
MRKREANSKRLEIDGKVLCIDADPENHAMVASVLAAAPGIELRIAVNGQSGIRAVHTAMPDLILLNMNLPDMGGMDVVRSLQSHMADGRCQVVALTNEAFSIDIVKALSLGVREYWLKPLRADLLQRDLLRVLNASVVPRERPRSSASFRLQTSTPSA